MIFLAAEEELRITVAGIQEVASCQDTTIADTLLHRKAAVDIPNLHMVAAIAARIHLRTDFAGGMALRSQNQVDSSTP